jgi:hypothetical protein
MNNSNDLTKTILQTIGSTNEENNFGSGLESTSNINDSGSGIFGYLQSITWYTWIIIILVLGFIGYNIFIYLGNEKLNINEYVQNLFGYGNSNTIKPISENNEKEINENGNDIIKQQQIQGTPLNQTIPQPDVMKNNTLNQALNTAVVKQNSNNEYEADDTNSNIQKGVSKSGYCYIGEDQGYRSCVYVKESDTCMSGDIFPTNDICVNPNLRA